MSTQAHPSTTSHPSWFRWQTLEPVLGWASLLILLLTPLMPGFQTECNAAAAVGIALIAVRWKQGKEALVPGRWLMACIAIYFASCVLSSVVPAALRTEPYVRMQLSANNLWHALRAITAAGLCLMLIHKREDLLQLLCLILLALFIVNLWAPLDHWLRGGFFIRSDDISDTRMDGTKGNSARFAGVLFLLSFLPWILIVAPSLRRLQLPAWVKWTGLAIAILTPLVLLNNKELLDLGAPSSWFPGGPRKRGAWNYSFYALCGLLIASGSAIWYGIARWTRHRIFFVVTSLILIGIGINFTLTRLPLGLLLLSGVVLILLRGGNVARIGLVVMASGAILIAGWFRAHPGTLLNAGSIQQRANFWSGACEMISLNPVFGVGYGSDAVHHEWMQHFGLYLYGNHKLVLGGMFAPLSPRYYVLKYHGERLMTNASHVHNMWLQILAERGIVGFIAFHLLWFSAIFLLLRAKHPDSEVRRIAQVTGIFLAFLLLNGLLEHPVRKTDEILYWVIPAIGFAALRFKPAGNGADDLATQPQSNCP